MEDPSQTSIIHWPDKGISPQVKLLDMTPLTLMNWVEHNETAYSSFSMMTSIVGILQAHNITLALSTESYIHDINKYRNGQISLRLCTLLAADCSCFICCAIPWNGQLSAISRCLNQNIHTRQGKRISLVLLNIYYWVTKLCLVCITIKNHWTATKHSQEIWDYLT